MNAKGEAPRNCVSDTREARKAQPERLRIMIPKFYRIIGAILVVTFVLLGIGQCGYKDIDSMHSLNKKSDKIRNEFPDIEHIEAGIVATILKSENAASVLLVDCRTAEEFAVSHLAGAVNLETKQQVDQHLKNLKSRPDTIVVYCSVGQRSAALTEELKKAEIKNVKNFVGSIFAWANEDRPMVDSKGKTAEKVHTFNKFWGRLVKASRRAPLK